MDPPILRRHLHTTALAAAIIRHQATDPPQARIVEAAVHITAHPDPAILRVPQEVDMVGMISRMMSQVGSTP